MTKDALIEALAKWRYESSLESMMGERTWQQASEYGKAAFLAEATAFAPVIVELFAAWLADRLERQQLHHPVEAWRGDMA